MRCNVYKKMRKEMGIAIKELAHFITSLPAYLRFLEVRNGYFRVFVVNFSNKRGVFIVDGKPRWGVATTHPA